MKVLRRPVEFALAAAVAVVQQAGDALPGAKPRRYRHLQRIQGQ
jgi:hypothetical protein